MAQTEHPVVVLLKIVVIQFVLPALLSVVFAQFMRKHNFIKDGDMKLDL